MIDENRCTLLQNDQAFDVLIIGGGIVGAGICRDAAMRGLRTALVEQNDFSSGTSSRSSRLLHGGLRYLAQGRIALVREASREKKILHRIAPHLATPLPFIFPTRKGPTWARWKLSIGVKVYDWLCGGSNLGPSETWNAQETQDALPGLKHDDLTGAVRYYDALTNDARLVLDTLSSASRHDAVVSNYCRYESAERIGDLWEVVVTDQLTKRSFTVRTRSIVNASGPWADRLPHSQAQIRPTKGIHIVIPQTRLPLPGAVVMPKGKRILFAIPWGERVFIGTTDTDYTGPLDTPDCTAEDIDYVLAVTNEHFPGTNLQPSEVLSTWAGLRPLIAKRNGNPSDISRKHQILLQANGWMDVTGGKLTTYRLMAEQAVDRLVRHLGIQTPASRTANEPLLNAPAEACFSAVIPVPPSQEAVQHYCQNEWAVHLEDVMIRRSGWHYYTEDVNSCADAASHWMAETLNWTEAHRQAERAHYPSAKL
jgi:glycerol-3-phosphate dehydrogenase